MAGPGFRCTSSRLHGERFFLHGREVTFPHGQLPPQPPTWGHFLFHCDASGRGARLLVEHIDILGEVFRSVREQYPFRTDAIVILSDHLHAIWTLPGGDADYPGRWRAIKGRFFRRLLEQGVEMQRNGRGEYTLWQRRYWEHTVRDDTDRQRHVDYIHYNPVKHRSVSQVADWPYSSFHRFVRDGLLSRGWAGTAMTSVRGEFGE